jgi:hypothetical protein
MSQDSVNNREAMEHAADGPPPTTPSAAAGTNARDVGTQIPTPVPIIVQPAGGSLPVTVQLPTAPVVVVVQTPPDAPAPDRWLWINVGAFVSFGTLVSWWLYYYTDWLEAFTGLLSLTGIFAWLAFVTKVVPEGRLKYFQANIWGKTFESPAFGIGCGVALCAFLVIASLFGAIEVSSVQGGPDQSLWVYEADSQPDWNSPERIPANGQYRALQRAGHEYRVHVPGYPERALRVHAWSRTQWQVPFSFLRPVVLIWPEKSVITQVKEGDADLKIYVNDIPLTPTPFDGKAIWVGCEEMAVPRHVFDTWLKELSELRPAVDAAVQGVVQAKWSQPRALPGGPAELRADAKVRAELIRKGENHPYAATFEYSVRPVRPSASFELQDMVQPVALRVLKKQP